MMDSICLKGMKFHVLVGVYPHEMEIPQPLEIDLSVNYRRDNTGSQSVVDYAKLYTIVSNIVTPASEEPVGYIEDLAERIALDVLKSSRIVETQISIRKPNVSLPGLLDYAEVTIRRSRSMYEDVNDG